MSQRIAQGEWQPGGTIPSEALLARSYGCSRSTVNRALQELARSGVVLRRRRAGTQVATEPVHAARLEIPLVRREIENMGRSYSYELLSLEVCLPPERVAARLAVPASREILRVRSLHSGDRRPYQLEDRWIDVQVAPDALSQSFTETSPNEWLVKNCPFTQGTLHFSVAAATSGEAGHLHVESGDPIFVVERLTWLNEAAITLARMIHPASHGVTMKV